jgi:hypothetical protein
MRFELATILLYQRFGKRKNHSPESIKIRFVLPQGGGFAAAKASPAPVSRGRGEQTLSSENSRFVLSEAAAYLEHSQTFEIILPNLIHKSKKRNLR